MRVRTRVCVQAGYKETLLQQFDIVQKGTKQSAVQKYGTFSFMSEPIGDFLGEPRAASSSNETDTRMHMHMDDGHASDTDAAATTSTAGAAAAVSGKQDSRDIKLHYLFNKYLRKVDNVDGHLLSRTENMQNGMELLKEVKSRLSTLISK